MSRILVLNGSVRRGGNTELLVEDAGTVLVRGAKEKADVKNTDGLKDAYRLGSSM